MSFLEVRSVCKHFGGLKAVDGCSLDVPRNSIVGLIGPNGAGKSTLFNVIAGFLPTSSGEVRFIGELLTGRTANEIAQRGVVRTFQTPHGFTGMTVMENLMVAPLFQKGENIINLVFQRGAVRKQEVEGRDKAMHLLTTIGLADRRNELVGNLNPSEARMLEFARQLLLNPRVLLLDEPAAGIDPTFQGKLTDIIREMRAQGLTLLIVDHNLSFVMNLCEHVYVMDRGRIIADGPPSEIVENKSVREVYLGRSA
ncbi:MAG: ABC transporter ATP-binding protein [Chloroflexi bacterium]|nr:ABC transporter ATP-binding protein [Chloroflexota bacterium]